MGGAAATTAVEEPLDLTPDGAVDQLVATAGEVPVHRGPRRPGPHGHGFDGERPQALLGDLVEGRVEDPGGQRRPAAHPTSTSSARSPTRRATRRRIRTYATAVSPGEDEPLDGVAAVRVRRRASVPGPGGAGPRAAGCDDLALHHERQHVATEGLLGGRSPQAGHADGDPASSVRTPQPSPSQVVTVPSIATVPVAAPARDGPSRRSANWNPRFTTERRSVVERERGAGSTSPGSPSRERLSTSRSRSP